MNSYKISQNTLGKGLINIFVSFCLIFNVCGIIPQKLYAQEAYLQELPTPGDFVKISDRLIPASLRGLKVYPQNPFQFDFFLQQGEQPLQDEALKEESQKLVKYFLASLTVPEQDMWVNLSPYEEDRIIPDQFSLTEMGRDLLAQDYVLKQLTSSLMYPEDDLGSEFWEQVYDSAYEKFGTMDIPVDTFNKVWIVPEKAVVYESAETNSVFVLERKLKVMMEADYLAMRDVRGKTFDENSEESDISQITSDIVREVIIPVLEKEVNEGEHFSKLRQIYDAMVLATWFKRNLKENIIAKAYANQNKVEGIDIQDKNVKDKIYDYYMTAFQKGVYNYVKDEYDPVSQNIIPRKYFSGGVQFAINDSAMSVVRDKSKVSTLLQAAFLTITIGLINPADLYGYFPTTSPVKEVLQQKGSEELKNIHLQEAIQRVRESGQEVNVNTIYEQIRRLEKKGHPAISLDREFFEIKSKETLVNTPEALIAPMRILLQKALMQENSPNQEIYESALVLIEKSLKEKADMPLGDLGYLLKDLDVEEDVEARRILRGVERLSSIYQYNEFDENRPTVLLMHGAGRGNFNSFSNSVEKLKDHANVIFYQYDYLDPLDENTERFYERLKQFQETHRLNQPLMVLAYSNGSTTFRSAVLNYEDDLWKNVHLVRIAEPLAGTRESLISASVPGMSLGAKVFAGRYYHLSMAHTVSGDAQKFLTSPESDVKFRTSLGSITTVTAKNDHHALPLDEKSINPFVNNVYERARRAFGVAYGFVKVSPEQFLSMPVGEALKTYVEVDTKNENPHSVIAQDAQTVNIVTHVFNNLHVLTRQKVSIDYTEQQEEKRTPVEHYMPENDSAMSVNVNQVGLNQKLAKFPSLKAFEVQRKFLDLISEKSTREEPVNILFVCRGNLYRSRVMHLLFEQMLRDKGMEDVTVSSAGTFAWEYDQSRLYDGDIFDRLVKSLGFANGGEIRGTLDELMVQAFMEEDLRSLDVEYPKKASTPLDKRMIYRFIQEMNQVGDLTALFKQVSFEHQTTKEAYVKVIERWQKGLKEFNEELQSISMYQLNSDGDVNKALRRSGVDNDLLENFVSNVVTKDMVENATAIVTTDFDNWNFLVKGFHTAVDKTFIFNDIAPDAFKNRSEVPDPAENEISPKALADRIRQGFSKEILPNFIATRINQQTNISLNDVLLDFRQAGFASLRDMIKKTLEAKQYIHEGEDSRAFYIPGTEKYVLLESRLNTYLPLWGDVYFNISPLHERNLAVPLMTIGNYKVLRFMRGAINGVPWQKRRKERTEEIDQKYLESLKHVSEGMSQEAYDEFASNLIVINENGYTFDYVNPNNILLEENRFNLVDLERNYDKKEPSLSSIVGPLLDVFHVEAFVSTGEEDVLFNANTRKLRRGVLQKSLKAAIKNDLPIPDEYDAIMVLAFKQSGLEWKWPEYRQRTLDLIAKKKQEDTQEDYAMTLKEEENFIPKSGFDTDSQYKFAKQLINKATRNTKGVPLNAWMVQQMEEEEDDTRILRTIDISLTDIIKGVFPPFNVERPLLYEELADIDEFPVIMAEHDIFLVSTSHNGMNAKVVKLGFARTDKRAVAVINFMVPNVETITNTDNALRVINAAGFGPLIHGMHYQEDEEGEIVEVGIITDIATGDFIDKTGDRITRETFHQFRTLHKILKRWGYVYGSDFQYFVTQSGNIEVIDPICIFESRDQYYKHLAQLFLSMEEGLAIEIISELMQNEPDEIKEMYAYMNDAVERHEPMSIGTWTEIATLMKNVENSLKNKGGIDLNADQLTIETVGDKIQFEIPNAYTPQQLLDVPGFAPFIINISPTTNMPLLLGINSPATVPSNLYSSVK